MTCSRFVWYFLVESSRKFDGFPSQKFSSVSPPPQCHVAPAQQLIAGVPEGWGCHGVVKVVVFQQEPSHFVFLLLLQEPQLSILFCQFFIFSVTSVVPALKTVICLHLIRSKHPVTQLLSNNLMQQPTKCWKTSADERLVCFVAAASWRFDTFFFRTWDF